MTEITFRDYVCKPTSSLVDIGALWASAPDDFDPERLVVVSLAGASWEIVLEDGDYVSDTVVFDAPVVPNTRSIHLDLGGLSSQTTPEELIGLFEDMNIGFEKTTSAISHSVSLIAGERTFSYSRDGYLEAIGVAAR